MPPPPAGATKAMVEEEETKEHCPHDRADPSGAAKAMMKKEETKQHCPHNRDNAKKNRVSFCCQRMSIVETDLPDAAASSCLLTTGAAGKNVALFKEMRKSCVLTAFNMDGATFKTEDDTISFRCTKPSMEFPENVKESDLFAAS
jgi:hypothetical protein